MKKFLFLLLSATLFLQAPAQKVATPDEIYGQLFVDVQMNRIFPDNKTFVDCIPKRDPRAIVADYMAMKNNPNIRYSLKLFVEENFHLPRTPQLNYITQEKDVVMHIKNLWGVLRREKDSVIRGSSLLALPYPYIVPGGRFREIYYWDSYFTMLGLKESGESEMISNMVRNFSYLIHTYGHIPNGNRSYYLSRSQPPYFSNMVELLAGIKGNSTYRTFLPSLIREHNFWMTGASTLKPNSAYKYVVRMPDGSILNRYWDERNMPRQESYKEDIETADKAINDFIMVALFMNAEHQKRVTDSMRKAIYRHLRAGATSGMDFSSRWFEDGEKLTTIKTTDIVPVDLNCLLYHLERTIAKAYKLQGNSAKATHYENLAARRKRSVNKYFWSRQQGFYVDYHFRDKRQLEELTLAGMMPFFLHVADKNNIMPAADVLRREFLKEGGLLTTLRNTGEQWDAPNGWPPLQWISIIGLDNYGEDELAKDIAGRWVRTNLRVFENTGKLMEKYNVVDISLEAGGGEYPGQDGFGWTNGVLLGLMKKYNIRQTN